MPENPAGFGQPDADPDGIPTEPTAPPAAGSDGSRAGAPAGESASESAREQPDAGGSGALDSDATSSEPEAAGGPDQGAARADTAAPSRSGAETGEPTPRDRRSPAADEAAFLELIARFDQEPPPGERLWPAAEDVDEPRRPSVIIIRPAGRQPDGMPPDGRHLADDDSGERTMPPTPLGPRGADGAGPVDLDGADAEGTGPGHTDAGPGGSDRADAETADTARRGTDRDVAGAGTAADTAADAEPGSRRAGTGRGRDSRSRLDGIEGLDAAVRAAFGTPGREVGGHPGPNEDDHYVPPPPPPLPRLRPVTRWALGSIALGVAILVVPTLIGLNQSRSQDVAGVLLILGGVGTLVARMGERPPTDFDGPDDGAVV